MSLFSGIQESSQNKKSDHVIHLEAGYYDLNELAHFLQEKCCDNCDCGDTTPGISTSDTAKKGLLKPGANNQSDLNAVKPNSEYCKCKDNLFIGDGDDPETSKTNIPAILAAKTAGGSPWPHTISNNISNKLGSDVFKLKKLQDDYYD